MRYNASGKTILKYFVDKMEERGAKYYARIPWDERNLADVKEFYPPVLLGELIDYYFRVYTSWSVKDFIYKLPVIAEEFDKDQAAKTEYNRLLRETRERMRKAGLE